MLRNRIMRLESAGKCHGEEVNLSALTTNELRTLLDLRRRFDRGEKIELTTDERNVLEAYRIAAIG